MSNKPSLNSTVSNRLTSERMLEIITGAENAIELLFRLQKTITLIKTSVVEPALSELHELGLTRDHPFAPAFEIIYGQIQNILNLCGEHISVEAMLILQREKVWFNSRMPHNRTTREAMRLSRAKNHPNHQKRTKYNDEVALAAALNLTDEEIHNDFNHKELEHADGHEK